MKQLILVMLVTDNLHVDSVFRKQKIQTSNKDSFLMTLSCIVIEPHYS